MHNIKNIMQNNILYNTIYILYIPCVIYKLIYNIKLLVLYQILYNGIIICLVDSESVLTISTNSKCYNCKKRETSR